MPPVLIIPRANDAGVDEEDVQVFEYYHYPDETEIEAEMTEAIPMHPSRRAEGPINLQL